MARSGDVPGNAMASAAAYTKQLVRLGEKVYDLDRIINRLDESDLWVEALRFRAPNDNDSQWLAVVTARQDGTPVVGFHGAATFQETLEGLVNRLANNSMKWRPDEYKK